MTTLTDHYGDQMEIASNKAGGANVIVRQASRSSAVVRIPVADIRAALDKIDPPKIANQERNREALIEHIAEQDRIIRRCNEQIENQARNAEEAQRAIEAIEAELSGYRAMHSEQMKTIARLQKNPRPLAANNIDGDSVIRAQRAAREHSAYLSIATVHDMLAAALTPPPVTLESIVDEALDKYTGGDLNGDEVGPYVASKYAELTDGSN